MAEMDVQPQPAGRLCPKCEIDLLFVQRASVEINSCPQCRGIWLDRAEVDKLLKRSLENDPRLSGLRRYRGFVFAGRQRARTKTWLEEILE
jgi:Zn-finger nucleic acid-binding protein